MGVPYALEAPLANRTDPLHGLSAGCHFAMDPADDYVLGRCERSSSAAPCVVLTSTQIGNHWRARAEGGHRSH